jgi:hypothetical protein
MALIGKVAAWELRDGSLAGAVREPPPHPPDQRVCTQVPLIEAKTGGFACNGRSHFICCRTTKLRPYPGFAKGLAPVTGQICLAFPL